MLEEFFKQSSKKESTIDHEFGKQIKFTPLDTQSEDPEEFLSESEDDEEEEREIDIRYKNTENTAAAQSAR